jgi:abnormal spindle-like microcephaly-associated protein
MKQSLLFLILSYNPLWLRVGLETVYGELLPLGSNTDLVSLSRFLVTRLLSNPDILSEYAHPTVPHSYREGHQEALNKFILKKFLELVFFLDYAKEHRLIKHNPCLFCRDSQHKASRDIITAFSRDYLAGEGDIIKHLAYFGFEVKHKQTVLDEFDYAVTNIAVDLRCGLRLTKVRTVPYVLTR